MGGGRGGRRGWRRDQELVAALAVGREAQALGHSCPGLTLVTLVVG